MHKKTLQNVTGKLFVHIFVLYTFFSTCPLAVFAAGNRSSAMVDNYINYSVVYMFTAAISFLLLILYLTLIKIRTIPFILLYTAVFLVNIGYLFLSLSGTVEEALLANRISYLGAVFLPLLMIFIIIETCQLKKNKKLLAVLTAYSCSIFLIAASGGYNQLYYKEVFLIFVNGTAKLKKIYGPLHKCYYIYLFSMFFIMTAVVITAFVKKKIESFSVSIALLVAVLLNIVVWFIEQMYRIDFEFLAVSYIVTEIFMLFIYGIMDEYHNNYVPLPDSLHPTGNKPDSARNENTLPLPAGTYSWDRLVLAWPALAGLTSRESEVFMMLLENKRRKDIAERMYVSENTVKKHTSHIFEKLAVTSRNEIIDRVNTIRW